MTGIEDGLQVAVLVAVFMVSTSWMVWRSLSSMPSSSRNLEAEDRAATLLRELLADSEYQELANSSCLTISSPSVPGRRYVVPNHPGTVDVYDGQSLVMRLCVQPAEPLPRADVILMHKLMIQGSEQEYLQRANVVYSYARGRLWIGHNAV